MQSQGEVHIHKAESTYILTNETITLHASQNVQAPWTAHPFCKKYISYLTNNRLTDGGVTLHLQFRSNRLRRSKLAEKAQERNF